MDAANEIPGFRSAERTKRVAGIVRATGRRLMRFIRSRVTSEADAEDVLQDVWQELTAAMEEGPIEHLGAWLYTVARHRIIDGYRRRRKMASLEAPAANTGPSTEAMTLGDLLPAEEAGDAWRPLFWADLHAALAELPEEQRRVFIGHELEGLTFQEMAGKTGENINTLLSRKRYAVLHLRRRLAAWLENSDEYSIEES